VAPPTRLTTIVATRRETRQRSEGMVTCGPDTPLSYAVQAGATSLINGGRIAGDGSRVGAGAREVGLLTVIAVEKADQ